MSVTQATILVVDDIDANRLVLKRMLIRHGHQVFTAEHGREALELMQLCSFDLVLLDIMMPVMDGYELLAVLQQHATLQHVPVVIVSALGDVESIARCIGLGAADYLFKPVNMTLLEARVTASLARKQLHDRAQAAYAAVEVANNAKSEFIALVSHELKNPIAAICAYIRVLQLDTSAPLSASQAQCLQAIDELSWYMDSLLVDLNDLSQFEMGGLQLQLGPLALRNAIDKATLAVQRAVQAKEQQLTIDVLPDLPPIWADSMRVVQIVTNLLSNASKYTPAGGMITLSAHHSQPTCVEIVIRDTGIGMSSEDQARIFEKFFRSPEPAARQERGSGLGLHITQRLVAAQRGHIWFESGLGVGTTFHVTLPLAESASPPQSRAAQLMTEVCLPS